MRRAVILRGLRLGKRLFVFLRRAPSAVALAAACLALGPVFTRAEALTLVTAKGESYHEVRILSVSPSTVTIRHADGLAQLPLRDLPAEWQSRLDFDPARAAAYEETLAAEGQVQAEQRQRENERVSEQRAQRQADGTDSAVGRALGHFGQPAPLASIDLRPNFRALELAAKDQGRRPSCAVFAVLGALEYENAQVAGQAEKLSEEYVIWATRRSLGLPTGEKRDPADPNEPDGRDAGFSLGEVLAAVRAFGVPLQAQMPNTFGIGMDKIADPGDDVVTAARSRRQVFTHLISGRDNTTRLQNILQVLNEGVPVAIGLRWPHWRTLHQPLLSNQPTLAGYMHDVTLVGYTVDDGRRDTLRFIFRNSWGMQWGVGGYGFATWDYLQANLLDAVVIEVRPRKS